MAAVRSFVAKLRRRERPRSDPGHRPVHRNRGLTQMQASLGDRGWRELVERHHAIVRAALSRWRGVENDTAGDGFSATFDGPARTARAGRR